MGYLNHRLLAVASIHWLRLPACAALAKGCARSTFMGISNCRAAQSRRSTVNWPMARRSAVGQASQFRHESNHGETGKGGPLWGLKSARTVWPNHGVFGAISWWFGANSWCFEIMAFSRFGGPEAASPIGQAHPHSEGYGLENPKD